MSEQTGRRDRPQATTKRKRKDDRDEILTSEQPWRSLGAGHHFKTRACAGRGRERKQSTLHGQVQEEWQEKCRGQEHQVHVRTSDPPDAEPSVDGRSDRVYPRNARKESRDTKEPVSVAGGTEGSFPR